MSQPDLQQMIIATLRRWEQETGKDVIGITIERILAHQFHLQVRTSSALRTETARASRVEDYQSRLNGEQCNEDHS